MLGPSFSPSMTSTPGPASSQSSRSELLAARDLRTFRRSFARRISSCVRPSSAPLESAGSPRLNAFSLTTPPNFAATNSCGAPMANWLQCSYGYIQVNRQIYNADGSSETGWFTMRRVLIFSGEFAGAGPLYRYHCTRRERAFQDDSMSVARGDARNCA